jgi:hypothetical protein
MKYHLSIACLLVIFSMTSCLKKDQAVTLPLPGPVKQMVVTMGNAYDNQIYVSLSQGTQVTRPYRQYDLAFEASASGLRVYLNSGKLMYAVKAPTCDMLLADTVGKEWCVDNEQLSADSTAIGSWWNAASGNPGGVSNVYVIDRGKSDFMGANRFRKLQIVNADASHYHIRYSKYDNSGLTEVDIPKDSSYSLMYFSFDKGAVLVDQAPPAAQWDIVFTKYTHVYFDYPYGSPFRFYSVTGGLSNVWRGTECAKLQKDSFPNYIPFSECNYANVPVYNFSPNADVIGYDWKFYDFSSSSYTVRPDEFYLVEDQNGLYYKIRMVDFYDQHGTKGTITFEYQRM